jgi:hypothetical protein
MTAASRTVITMIDATTTTRDATAAARKTMRRGLT